MDLLHKNEVNSGKFISKYLDNIWSSVLGGETGFAFFNSTEEKFSEYINNYLDSLEDKEIILRKKIDNARYQNPYYPFLDFVKEQLKEINDFNKYLEKTEIYPLQKSVFLNFLQGKKVKRREEILLEELDYEKQQMLKSLLKLFSKLSKSSPVVVVIENLHWANLSTLKFIKYLMKNDCEGNFMFIFSFVQNISLLNKNQKEEWEEFLEELHSQQMIIDLKNTTGVKKNRANWDSYSVPEIEDLIELSSDCFNFLALKEAKEYITEAYDRYQRKSDQLEEEYYLKMFNLLGDIHNYLDENGNALIYYQSIVNYLQQRKRTRDLADVYRKIAMIHFKKYNMKTADKLANQSLKLAQEAQNELQIFKAYFQICLIEEKRRAYSQKQSRNFYNRLIKLGKKLELDNTLARCYFSYFYIINDYKGNEALTHYNKVIKIAKKYNNEYRMSVAYHIRAIVYKRERNYNQVFKSYKKSIKLKEKIGDKTSLAFIYNGLGYSYFLVEDYEQAYNYYSQALEPLKAAKDYHEIGLTCFNLGLNLLWAFEYEESIFYLTKIIEILRNSQVENLMFHSKSRIYTLLGINYLKTGNLNKVQECIIKIDSRGAIDMTGEDKSNLDFFFLEFFMGLIFKEESNYKEAKKHFEWALKLCGDIEANNEYLYPKFYYEYGLMCKELGPKKKAEDLFKQGLKYCEDLEYDFHKNLILKELREERVEVKRFNFGENRFNFDWIPESVKLEETLDKLYRQIDKINFLNNLQNILVKASKKESLIAEVMDLIEDNFLIEVSYLYLKEEGRWKNYFTNEEEANFSFNIRVFVNQLRPDITEKIIINPEKNYSQELVGQFNSLIFVPLKSDKKLKGCIFCGTISKELVLTNDDLKILSIAAKQLSIALERIERDRELKEAYHQLLVSSKTDSLTGIYNRRELRNKLINERKRSERYGNKYSVMFIDLDNFKYYNDQFGHDVGDLVLCKFAELLEVETREVDFVSRFGGDEFVLVLPETTAEEVYVAAKRIKKRLIILNQFQADIEKKLEEKIKIPQKNKLSCSIGIAEYKSDLIEESNQLLKMADEAVYDAKAAGKDQIKIWGGK